jgi:hypothetical protein
MVKKCDLGSAVSHLDLFGSVTSIENRHRQIDDKYIGIQGMNGLDGLLAIHTELTTSNSSGVCA